MVPLTLVTGYDGFDLSLPQISISDKLTKLPSNKTSKEDLKKKSENLGLNDSVIFLDWLPVEDMPKLISMADITIDTYP